MSPFVSAGEQSRWKIVYARLCLKSIGETVTYEELGPLLDLDPRQDRHVMQAAIRRAADEYLDKDLRALEPVRGVGYTVVHPNAQLRLSRGHSAKARTQLMTAHRLVTSVDQTDMAADVATMYVAVSTGLASQLDVNRRQDLKNKQFEQAIEAASVRVERTEESVGAIQERMAALEAKLVTTRQHDPEAQ